MGGEVRTARLVPTPWLCGKSMAVHEIEGDQTHDGHKSYLLLLLGSLGKRRRSQRGHHVDDTSEGIEQPLEILVSLDGYYRHLGR